MRKAGEIWLELEINLKKIVRPMWKDNLTKYLLKKI